MKFSCSRCNTRYSIADERVRGKILKIRCKSCGAVIAVKEGMASGDGGAQAGAKAQPATRQGTQRPAVSKSAPAATRRPLASAAAGAAAAKRPVGTSSALSSAFEKAMASEPSPSASASMSSAAVRVDAEWYLASQGIQSGPFDLRRARAWVAAQAPDAELYCWSDGFDDWKRVEDIGPFADVERAARFEDDLPTSIDPGARSPGLLADLGPADFGPRGPDTGPELEIGEVSRIVRLPIMPPDRGATDAGVGRLGRGSGPAAALDAPATGPHARQTGAVQSLRQTGAVQSLRQTGAVQSLRQTGAAPALGFGQTGGLPALAPTAVGSRSRGHSKGFWMLVGSLGLAVVAMAGFLIYLMLSSEDDGPALRRSKVAGGELGLELGQVRTKSATAEPESPGDKTSKSKAVGKRAQPRTTPRVRTTTTGSGGDEVDLGEAEGQATELTPDDVLDRYKKNSFAINRCYERALKKDPFLDIRRAEVTISVDMRGRASASIPAISNETLRSCLEATIQSWRFSSPKEPLRTQITMVFKAR